MAIAYRVKERLRDFYRTDDPNEATALLDDLRRHCVRTAMPPELQRLGRTIERWFEKICNWHKALVTNGPTEALNNLIKRIKRIGFGFRIHRLCPDPGTSLRRQAELAAVLGSIVVR